MANLAVICASVFAISILLTGTITPFLLIQDADAIKSRGTSLSEINSNKVCGNTLCSAGITSATDVIAYPADLTTPDVELLFVQSSTSGTFDDKEKTLTLVGVSPATVYFSDRPNRVTGFEDTESFVGMWSEGEDSFASDPPNAVLEMHGSDGQSDVFIIELMNPIYDVKSKTLQYTIKILAEASDGLTHYNDRSDSKIPATFEDAVLFIDSFNLGKAMKKIFIDEPQQGDERPATILPDLPIPTPWHIVNKGGDAIGGVAQHEYQKMMQSIDVGDWEEHAVKYSIKMRMLSAHAGGEFGEKIGGERGKQIGTRAGAAIGQAIAATITKTLSSGKIDNNSVIDNMDVADLINNLQNIVTSTASNYQIAYYITDNMMNAQEQNIHDKFVASMNQLGQESALAAAYDADNFCGSGSNDEFFENVLSKIFLDFLRVIIESWIFKDLQNGMTYDEIKDDLNKNMVNIVNTSIKYTFWALQDYCLIDSDNDMYSLIFNQLFIPDNTPISAVPREPLPPDLGYMPSGEIYPGNYANLPTYEDILDVAFEDVLDTDFIKIKLDGETLYLLRPSNSDGVDELHGDVTPELVYDTGGNDGAFGDYVDAGGSPYDYLFTREELLDHLLPGEEQQYQNVFDSTNDVYDNLFSQSNIIEEIADDVNTELVKGIDDTIINGEVGLYAADSIDYFGPSMLDTIMETLEDDLISDVPK